jgi:hypothetical protein
MILRTIVTCTTLALMLGGCSADPGAEPQPDAGLDDAAVDVSDAGSIDFGDVAVPDGAKDAGSCEPPDFLVVLDRSNSMGGSAGKTDAGLLPSKWSIATGALGDLVASPNDDGLRFGLEVFPDVAGSCASGTILVQPGPSHGPVIKSELAKTALLAGTPIGEPLAVAKKALASIEVTGRKQFVLLITDGGETCKTAPGLPAVQALAKAGVKTFVVGFGAAVNVAELNDLACAGLTAPALKTSCVQTSAGWEWNGTTPNLFHQAQDASSLKKALAAVAGSTCCGCTVN